MKLTATIKGLITGLLMLATALTFYYSKVPATSNWHYLIYILYALGISWTLISYRHSEEYVNKFGALFGQGFRCFIVVATVMVTFTGIFSKLNPQFAKNAAKAYKEYHMEHRNETSKTPAQIEDDAAKIEKGYTTGVVSSAIFGYLVIGAVVTAAVSGFILIRRNL